VAAKPQIRRARTNENYDVFERLRAALAQWNYSPVFSTLSIVVFAIAAYFSASLFVDHRPADTAALASVLKPTAIQLPPTEAPLPAEVPPAEATAPIEAAAPTKPAALPKASVPTKPAPDAPTQVSASSRMARIVRGVNLRAEPGGDVVTTLPRSQKVVVIQTNNKWVQIEADTANGRGEPVVGWVFTTFLETTPARIPNRTAAN
jgi:hypothetical protein